MQVTYMTPQALGVALRQSAALIRCGSFIRVAAMGQPVPYAGKWDAVRFDWSTEPERIAEFNPATNKGLFAWPA